MGGARTGSGKIGGGVDVARVGAVIVDLDHVQAIEQGIGSATERVDARDPGTPRPHAVRREERLSTPLVIDGDRSLGHVSRISVIGEQGREQAGHERSRVEQVTGEHEHDLAAQVEGIETLRDGGVRSGQGHGIGDHGHARGQLDARVADDDDLGARHQRRVDGVTEEGEALDLDGELVGAETGRTPPGDDHGPDSVGGEHGHGGTLAPRQAGRGRPVTRWHRCTRFRSLGPTATARTRPDGAFARGFSQVRGELPTSAGGVRSLKADRKRLHGLIQSTYSFDAPPRRRPAMAMTIRDIAREAGVSTATVSRALRGLPNVDPVTRERVRQVAERLDYVVSPAASRLASGRAGSIAVITPWIARWYFGRVLSGIEKVLASSDLDLILSSIGDPSELHHVPPHRKLRRRVDGFLVISLPPSTAGVSEIFESNVPIALIDTERDGCWSVGIDDRNGARMAVQHLINLGHERIGLISGRVMPTPFRPEENRWVGYRDTLVEAGLPVEADLEACGHFTIDGGERAMTTLLARPNPPTAVFAMSDEMAFGALRSLRAHGLQPGRDLSVVGFDGHEMSEFLDLTTVVQPVEEVGARAAQALLDAIDNPGAEPSKVVLPLDMVVRGSTALRRTT